MTAPRPTFRVMKNGYDRFAVDDAIERYAATVDSLQKQITMYQNQINQLNERLLTLTQQYESLKASTNSQKEAVDQIAMLSIREANEIIRTAEKNADEIVSQAIITSRMILQDLSKLYRDADHVKVDTKQKLEALLDELDSLDLPKMPDLRWIEDAENKLH